MLKQAQTAQTLTRSENNSHYCFICDVEKGVEVNLECNISIIAECCACLQATRKRVRRAAEYNAAGQLSQMPALNDVGLAADALSLPRRLLRIRTIVN